MKKLAFSITTLSIALCMLGLAFVMSASSAYSNYKFESLFYLFNSHILRVIIGLLLILVFAAVPYQTYKNISKWMMPFIAVILVLTLLFGVHQKGAVRSLIIGPINFQPVEFAKLFLIIHLASLIERKGELIHNLKEGFFYLFVWVIVIAGLVFAQPNVSNGLIIIFISLSIIYAGGAKSKHLFNTLAVSFFSALSLAFIFQHSRDRLVSFLLSIFKGGKINEQVSQAFLALGSGGWLGQGFGNSKQANGFLSEAYGDFIFAIIGEELGFIGSVGILLGYFIIFSAGLLIAKRTKDTFGQLLAFGISFAIIINAFINIGVTVGILPTTGVPLPFISYGGTSIIVTCISIGILVNIAVFNAKYILPTNKNLFTHAEEPI
jgi:cell division protein FtsW